MEDSIGAIQTFPKFNSLPKELRFMVWGYCLPSRIVQMHDSSHKKSKSIRSQRRTLTAPPTSAKPPLISQVCQESRAFVQIHGRVEKTSFWNTPVWLDQSTDMIHIDEDCYRKFGCRTDSDGKNIEPGLQEIIERTSIPLSVGRSIFLGFDPKYPKGNGFARWALRRIIERGECTVVLTSTSIHLNHRDACASGLFGHFTEGTPAFIDINDARQVKALSAACDMAPVRKGSSRNWDVLQVYEQVSSRYMDHYINCFLKCIRTMWLKENNALRETFIPWKFGQEQERKALHQKLLNQLPRFTFVIVVHFHESKYKISRKPRHKRKSDPSLIRSW
ncbi:hypothetical protein F4814DRAFT_48767 [Daldinia grandis]|nr:hypothetical protein F4814DRAFT_48767 [Daldinia grandis]